MSGLLRTRNEWLPTRAKWGIYFLWPGAWCSSFGMVEMQRLYWRGIRWTPIVRITRRNAGARAANPKHPMNWLLLLVWLIFCAISAGAAVAAVDVPVTDWPAAVFNFFMDLIWAHASRHY